MDGCGCFVLFTLWSRVKHWDRLFDSSPIKGEGDCGGCCLVVTLPCGCCLKASMTDQGVIRGYITTTERSTSPRSIL